MATYFNMVQSYVPNSLILSSEYFLHELVNLHHVTITNIDSMVEEHYLDHYEVCNGKLVPIPCGKADHVSGQSVILTINEFLR